MAGKLTIDVVPKKGGRIAVQHVFYGRDEEDCRDVFEVHAKGCEFLGPAIIEGRVEEEYEEIDADDWPDYSIDDDDEPDEF